VISEQLALFLRSVLLGGVLGLLYDLTRPPGRLGGRVWRAALDAAVSLTAVGSVFSLVMVGDGELRLFILAGAAGGAVLFFCLLSPVLRPIWDFWFRLGLVPFRLVGKFLKKVYEIFKKLFSFPKSWFTIIFNKGRSMPTGKGDEDMAGKQTTAKKRPSSKLTFLILMVLLVGIGVQLYNMYGQLQSARAEQEVYAQRLTALQQTNAQLAEDIANSGDQELIEEIARNELGMAEADEKIFRVGK